MRGFLARRLAWTGLHVRYDDVRDRIVVMARTVIYLYTSGGFLVLASLPLALGSDANIAVIAVIASAALAAAGFHLIVFDRLPLQAFQASGFFATGLVTTAIAFAGDLGTAYALFYFWVVLYAFFFYELRAAFLQLAAIVVGYAAVLFGDGGDLGTVHGVVLLATLAVAGVIVLFVKNSLLRVIESLLVSEARVRELFENADDIAYTLDLDARFTSVNRALERLTGYTRDELLGRPMTELVPPDLVDDVVFYLGPKRDSVVGIPYECPLVARDGEQILVEIVSRVISDAEGEPTGLQGIARDIRDRKRIEWELAAAERRYRVLIEELPLVTYIDEPSETASSIYISPQVTTLVGYSPEEWLADRELFPKILHPEDRERVLADHARVFASGETSWSLEYRVVARGGHTVWLRDEAMVVKDDAGKPLCVQGFLVDITAEKEAEAALRASEKRFRSLVQNASDVISVVDADLTIRYQTPGVAIVLGYSPEEVVGRKLDELVHPFDRGRLAALCEAAATQRGESHRREFRFRRRDGRWRYLDVVVRNELEDPVIGGIVVTGHDVSERKQLERRLTAQAFRDELTGLPNRAAFVDRIEEALARGRRNGTQTGVLFLDLDDFKTVNDSFGHVVGNRLLADIGKRLRRCVRRPDLAARFGGDEFGILVESIDERDVGQIAERILAAFDAPFRIEGRDLIVRPSIGIALAEGTTTDAMDANEMLRNADVAMYRAKEDGTARYALFEPAMHATVVERLELRRRLERALEREEFELAYQPIVDVVSGRVAAVEALVRWRDPTHGAISPADFIPLAEATGLIVPLGDFVLRTACRQARLWQGEHEVADFSVSVNLSACQVHESDFVSRVAAALAESRLPPSSLTLEMTESVLMQEVDETIGRLQELRGLGVRLALDDFGTGYSSLAYLKRLSLDQLKIDKSFVLNMHADAEDAAIVRSTVELGRNLGLRVLAEGVESEAIWAEIRKIGCDLAQGYHLGRPVRAVAIDPRRRAERMQQRVDALVA